MEIVLNNGFLNKKASFVEGKITSIQSSNIKGVLLHLKKMKQVSYIDFTELYFAFPTVSEELSWYKKSIDDDFLSDVMCILGLKSAFLDRLVDSLSHTEKIYLQILRCLDPSKKIVVFSDLFWSLDLSHMKIIQKLLSYLCEKDFVVIVASSDVNVLYRVSDYSLVWGRNLFELDTTNHVYTDVEKLVKNKFSVPVLSFITYKAKKEKNVKLFYSKDVRDIIKDIYKHV